jgi:hypothetical protein
MAASAPFLSWATTQVAASRTAPSAEASCLGFLTWAGVTAVMWCSPSASQASSGTTSPLAGVLRDAGLQVVAHRALGHAAPALAHVC